MLHIQKIPVNFFSIQDIHKILNKITERLNLDKNYHNTFPGSWVRSWCCNIYLYFGRIYRQRRQQRVSSRFTTGPASILCKNLCFFAIFIYLRVSLKDLVWDVFPILSAAKTSLKVSSWTKPRGASRSTKRKIWNQFCWRVFFLNSIQIGWKSGCRTNVCFGLWTLEL